MFTLAEQVSLEMSKFSSGTSSMYFSEAKSVHKQFTDS